jgi:cation diffusion facilitator CzcD-associated flavoprotein CzcO
VHLDVLIVGAGISGIDAAYHLQTSCPAKTFAIFESRGAIGGTWDLFRYPGIRSDSDMYTLGFPFRPWRGEKSLADGASILAYVRETAAAYGIDEKIVFHREVVGARWSSRDARWTIDARDPQNGEVHTVTCSFLYACAGYYDYAQGYTPELPGRERFAGRIVHPQFWPADLDVAGKRIVVIGSGATAVTLVPALAEQGAHVTMLQRSPTYILSRPGRDRVAGWLREKLPERAADSFIRWKNILISMAFFQYSRRRPAAVSRWLIDHATKLTGGTVAREHLTPAYKPWDQRLCFVPDADLFEAVKQGKAAIVTDHIDTFTERGILLRSGAELPADIIVTATGLVVRVFGGMKLDVDGTPVDPAQTLIYKGLMVSGVPNFAFAVGYTNASWTLKVDLASQYVCRLLNHMDEHGYRRAVPQRGPDVAEESVLDFTPGYVLRALDRLPRQGRVVPCKLYQNYVRDLWLMSRAPLEGPELELSL